MRLLQKGLVLLLGTTFGFGVMAMAAAVGMPLVFTEPRGENFGGALLWIGAVLVAGVLGAIAGCIGALHWTSPGSGRVWSVAVWAGGIVGLAIGLMISTLASTRVELWFQLLRATLIVPACVAGTAFLCAMLLARKPKAGGRHPL